jgi:hypothetical protein
MERNTLIEAIGIDEKFGNQIIDYLLDILTSDEGDESIGDIINYWRCELENGNLNIKEFSFACYVIGFITSDPNGMNELFQVYQNRKNLNKNNPKDIN